MFHFIIICSLIVLYCWEQIDTESIISLTNFSYFKQSLGNTQALRADIAFLLLEVYKIGVDSLNFSIQSASKSNLIKVS